MQFAGIAASYYKRPTQDDNQTARNQPRPQTTPRAGATWGFRLRGLSRTHGIYKGGSKSSGHDKLEHDMETGFMVQIINCQSYGPRILV